MEIFSLVSCLIFHFYLSHFYFMLAPKILKNSAVNLKYYLTQTKIQYVCGIDGIVLS